MNYLLTENILEECETLQFEGVFIDYQPGKYFKVHMTGNKKTDYGFFFPKPSLGAPTVHGLLFLWEHPSIT